jgi:pentatricopeptide repeat protein
MWNVNKVSKALNLFQQMQWEGVEPEPMTFVGVLNSCTSVAALEEGRHAQEQIIQRGCESDVFMGSSLVDMYAKCGSMEDALSVFNKMLSWNVVSWNAMLIEHYACMVDLGEEECVANNILKQTLKMLQAMCGYPTSMQLLATGFSVRMFSSRERQQLWRTQTE